MAKEIEKKFLVNRDKLPDLKDGQCFVQAYLSLDPHIRIRIIDDSVTVTIKNLHEDKSIRDEWEFNNKMTKPEIDGLLKLAINKPIEKIRYRVKVSDFIWEIDVYQGNNKGLVTAEVELKDINQKINYPDWIIKDREITNDPKYFNVSLGNNPYSEWVDASSSATKQ